jgi:hypothetical protein
MWKLFKCSENGASDLTIWFLKGSELVSYDTLKSSRDTLKSSRDTLKSSRSSRRALFRFRRWILS